MREFLDFDVAIEPFGAGCRARVVVSPGTASPAQARRALMVGRQRQRQAAVGV
jgi:hypothetical protein